MEASTALGVASAGRFEATVLGQLARLLAVSALCLLVATGLIVVARRAGGALSEPLSPVVLTILGLALAALALLFRRAFSPMRFVGPISYAMWAAPTIVLLIWAAAVSISGSDTLGLVALLGVLLLEEGYSWGRGPAGFKLPLRRGATSAELLDAPAVSSLPSASGEIAALEKTDRDEAVTQRMVRRQEDGAEAIEGWLRVDLAATQRHATAHLAICPPLDQVPECYAEQMDGPPARIQVAQVLAYGVRFEIRLDQVCQAPASVFIEFSIQASSAGSSREKN